MNNRRPSYRPVFYVLHARDKPEFKIGYTGSLLHRFDAIVKHFGPIDLWRSFVVEAESTDVILRLESYLKARLARHRISKMEKHGGRTEWFAACCFGAVLSHLGEVNRTRRALQHPELRTIPLLQSNFRRRRSCLTREVSPGALAVATQPGLR